MATVTTIPARPAKTLTPTTVRSRRKVAAYARVSTDLEEQQSSYQAQIDHYTDYIQGRADWEFVGMYADEGISGTSTKHRQGFQTMITDALAGRIDLIVTKSVSRFARNTVDSLTSVRALKEAGVEVYFEKENIWTLDSKGELLITIMSSLAQEESRSISENVTWGHRRRFAEGKVMVPYASLLGYKKGDDGGLAVDEDQARIVRRIYREYLAGHSPKTIAAHLTEDGIPTPLGKKTWNVSTINSILRNEKYKGDALLQKTFTVDFLTKTTKRNEGEIPQYYVTGNHEAIIAPAVWDQVQREIELRSTRPRSFAHPFASRIQCGCCGGWYGSKTWHAGSKYEKRVWRCNRRYDKTNETPCTSRHITDDEIITTFEQAIGQFAPSPSPEVLEAALAQLGNSRDLEDKLAQAVAARDSVAGRINQLIQAAAHAGFDPGAFEAQQARLEADYQVHLSAIESLERQLHELEAKRAAITAFHQYRSKNPASTYTPEAWRALVDHATIHPDGTITITFNDGTSI